MRFEKRQSIRTSDNILKHLLVVDVTSCNERRLYYADVDNMTTFDSHRDVGVCYSLMDAAVSMARKHWKRLRGNNCVGYETM